MDGRLLRAGLGAALLLPGAAQAAPSLGALPLALSAAASLEQGRCASAALPAAGEARADAPALTKASAILGGQVSALEAIRREQAGLAPAAGPAAVPGVAGECAMFVGAAAELAALRPGLATRALAPDDFLASRRLAVRHTGFDAQWNRVRRDALPASLATGLGKLGSGEATLAAVNAWANARIRYVEDRELYGKADYWAGARATLKRRAGDCEDIAVVKMALLAGAGVRREDMFLTIARDLARGADHALLVVRDGGRYWLLDNMTDRLLDASAANDYRPILSYSAGGKWLHGY